MYNLSRIVFHAGQKVFCALVISACLGQVPLAWANNPQIAGSGCVDAASADTLGTAPDNLSARTVVPIGVKPSTQLLNLLATNGHTATVEEFMESQGLSAAQTGARYVLLVGERHISSDDPQEMAAIVRAKANGVPIVLEGFEKRELKALTGLGLKSEAAVVQFHPGGRAQTITLIHPPPGGHTIESALNAVDRAIDKHTQASSDPTLDPTRQAYAVDIWTVWLHTGNVVCTLPYYAPEDVHFPQTGNLDFGIQVTLVAQTSPTTEKGINLQYLGAGFSPLAPEALPIASNNFFKGAYTLDMTYAGSLTARYGADLNGTTTTVQPTAAVGSHAVTKTNGFSWGLRSNCGTGSGCSVTADFTFSDATQKTQTIAERVIDASSRFGQVPDPNGSICGDQANGCWEGTHNIQYYLSSTATSSGGYSINLPKNDWYNFFDAGGWNPGIESSRFGDALEEYCGGCSVSSPTTPPANTLRNWPRWSSSSVLTEGEAGYTFSPNYTGNLTLNATVTAKEGIFSIGMGPKGGRLANGYRFVCFVQCGNIAEYALDLYTDSTMAAATIDIDASQVNYSGMPTCAKLQFTQPDLGIYKILNNTNSTLNLGKVNLTPFIYGAGVQTVAYNYVGNAQYLLGVSNPVVAAGQYEYIALCSSNQTSAPAMDLAYDNGNGVHGSIGFNGNGQVNGYYVPNVSFNAATRTFTVF